jgi:hypothetical protein
LLAAAAPPGRPLVLNPHGLEEFSRADWRKWLAYAPMRQALRRAARRADAVLATDHSMAPTVAAALGVTSARVQVIPNGISVTALDALADEERRANLRARLRLDDSSLRLVTVARLEHNKGLHLAVAALAGLGDALPASWGWWIVGRGREEAALRRQIAVAGLAQRITVLGALDDADLHNLLPRWTSQMPHSTRQFAGDTGGDVPRSSGSSDNRGWHPRQGPARSYRLHSAFRGYVRYRGGAARGAGRSTSVAGTRRGWAGTRHRTLQLAGDRPTPPSTLCRVTEQS